MFSFSQSPGNCGKGVSARKTYFGGVMQISAYRYYKSLFTFDFLVKILWYY